MADTTADGIYESERRLLAGWLAYVEATHRDAFTMATLRAHLESGRWYPALIDTARRIAAIAVAEGCPAGDTGHHPLGV